MKQPFNISQEKIDQIFKHCLFDLDPIHVTSYSLTYKIEDKKIIIKWRDLIWFEATITDKIFDDIPCSNFRVTLQIGEDEYGFTTSDFNIKELKQFELEIYNIQEKFFNDLINSIPCEATPLESHPRIISGE